MSDLKAIEKLKLEKLFGMESGVFTWIESKLSK